MEAKRAEIELLHLSGVPILQQLQMEEALLRADDRNWCILNTGSSPAIVMGISGKQDELIDAAKHTQLPIPLIRRFSGGGTVVVDENTCFVTFIFNTSALEFQPFPHPIMQWTEKFYQPIFAPQVLQLNENDYVIGRRKCGGNAQSLTKGRWLHHTSFLWDYDIDKMNVLTLPKKIPAYRQARPHHEFLCKLKEELCGHSLPSFLDQIKVCLHEQFNVTSACQSTLCEVLERPHRKATLVLE